MNHAKHHHTSSSKFNPGFMLFTGSLAQWVEYSLIVLEAWIQS